MPEPVQTTWPDQTLRACIEAHIPSTGDVVFQAIPTGHFNDSYFVETSSNAYVLRIAPADETPKLFYEQRMMRQEPGLHELVRTRTDIPVPHIIAADFSRQIIPRDYLILEKLAGKPLSECTQVDLDKVLHRVGDCVRQCHDITAHSFGYLGEHQPMMPQQNWGEAFAVMWRMLLDDIGKTGIYSREEVRAMVKLLDKFQHYFERPVAASLLHMDIWAQNILVDEQSNVTGLLDWDRALWGDPGIEFAVLDYCNIAQPAFWQGYGQVDPRTSAAAPVRTVFYLMYEVQKYIVIEAGRRNQREEALRYKEQAFQMVERYLGGHTAN